MLRILEGVDRSLNPGTFPDPFDLFPETHHADRFGFLLLLLSFSILLFNPYHRPVSLHMIVLRVPFDLENICLSAFRKASISP